MRQSLSSRRHLPVIFALLGAFSCNANVVVEDDATASGGTASGGTTTETGTDTGPDTGSGSGGASTSAGTGGSSDDAAAALVAEACPDIAAEPHYCVTIGYPGVVLAVGPDTGHLCQIGTLSNGVASDLSSIAVVGTSIHGCNHNSGVWRASILGGELEIPGVDCEAITTYQGGFLVADLDSIGQIKHYATFDDIANGTPIESFQVEPTFSRISTRANTLFTAWHSTDTVEVYQLPAATKSPDLKLEGFDDWVDGMSATSDGRLYLLGNGEHILVFDATTGKQLQDVEVQNPQGGFIAALHCWSH